MWDWIQKLLGTLAKAFFTKVAETPDGQIAAGLKDIAMDVCSQLEETYADDEDTTGADKQKEAASSIWEIAVAAGRAVSTVGINLAIEGIMAIVNKDKPSK